MVFNFLVKIYVCKEHASMQLPNLSPMPTITRNVLDVCSLFYSPGNRKSLRCSKHLSKSLCTTWKNIFMFQSEQSSFALVTVHSLIVCIEWSKRWSTWKHLLFDFVSNRESYFIVGLSTLFSYKLTGICSVKGNSLAIVPARSHELVMVTRDCKSSDQKYPQVVPWQFVVRT